jgi:3'(2'), 5'-bisphosphate nucleotidase
MKSQHMTDTLVRLAKAAGDAIMAVYEADDFEVDTKADQSPVTRADLAADRIIVDGLQAAWPDIAVVTEERVESHRFGEGRTHFLVDPLDGTREFVNRRGDFTVNIALIENGVPVAGVVYAPAIGRLFRTDHKIDAVEESPNGGKTGLRVAEADNAALRVVASRSHKDAATDAYIARYCVSALKSAGSSLKFCLLAAGEADLYPRLGRTMEWDTAAADAVLRAAGGHVVTFDGHAPLRYGKNERANPHFIAFGKGVSLL